ncbi:MAG TPA: DegT/DnrJ/EryC1/StrS family aminotransferase [Sphingobium sp.]
MAELLQPDQLDAIASLPIPIRSRWPHYEEDEIAAVTEVLRAGQVNSLVHGTRGRAFERAFAEYIGAPYALSLANGTLALELALRALGIGPGDEVIVPARSFFATVACVVAVGATPVFADIDEESQNIDPDSVERLLSPRTTAVLCVHLAGWPCDMDALVRLCNRHALWLVEDCAQAHGATWRGQKVGSFGDAAAFSFCTDKIMSTGGEGGMLLLRDPGHWKRAWAYKDHGKNPDKVNAPATGGSFRYVHDSFGSNWRMTEMQAAIGLVQLAKLPAWLEARASNARILQQALAGHSLIRLPEIPAHVGHAFYKFYFRVEGASDLIGALQAAGIGCGSGSCPDMSREAAFATRPARRDADLAAAARLGEQSVMLPVDHLLDTGDMRAMAQAVRHLADELVRERQA